MAMTFTFRENFDNFHAAGRESVNTSGPTTGKNNEVQFFAEKLRLPEITDHIPRPRLDRLLKRSLDQVGAVLVMGRAGTGKTALAAEFARQYEKAIWYRVEATDADWKTFSNYLAQGIAGNSSAADTPGVRSFVEKALGGAADSGETPRLIVLDDIHHVFDAEWFPEFFAALLQAISPAVHLLLLSRSKPSVPLWRLRSKQVLTVIEEMIIAFDLPEASALCERAGISPDESARFYAESFGRIGKLKNLIQTV